MKRLVPLRAKKDFDAWAYGLARPQTPAELPLLGVASLTAEDIKFAYNAWSLLRLSLFFGVEKPKVLSGLDSTQPSMDIARGGNRLFYMHCRVDGSLSPRRTKIALTPSHPRAQSIQSFDWNSALQLAKDPAGAHSEGLELVVGMENGLSQRVINECDHCVFIPQYGSIGSLSMISALAIVVQAAHTAHHCGWSLSRTSNSGGHMPESNAVRPNPHGRPHEQSMLSLTNEEVKCVLRERRQHYKLQLGVLMYNELADRNISAVMRNANAFNAEQMIVVNRRKFNRRGAVGTQHLLDVHFSGSTDDAACQKRLDGYAVWLLYPYYPYLTIYGDTEATSINDSEQTYLRPESPALLAWCHTGHELKLEHPLIRQHPHLAGTEIYLDDPDSLRSSVASAVADGYKGIMIAVPEEGASPHPSLAKLSTRVILVHHPKRLANTVQRGLNPALSTAIAFERLRSTIDTL